MHPNPLDWLTGVGKAIYDGFARLFGANAASTLVAAQKQIFSTAIGAFALQAVTDLESVTDITSEAKWAQAGAMIAAQAIVLGITIAKSEINLLIELAHNAARHQV